MAVRIEEDKNLEENEIIILCKTKTDKIVKYISLLEDIKLDFWKRSTKYEINLGDILFFETDEGKIRAHTINDIFFAKYKLYELEEKLPKNFIRISKSTIINTNEVYSIEKNITSYSTIKFKKSHKQVYVSRRYFKNLDQKMKGGD